MRISTLRDGIEIVGARVRTPVVWLTVGTLFGAFGLFDEMLARLLRHREVVDAHVVSLRAHFMVVAAGIAFVIALWRAARRSN